MRYRSKRGCLRVCIVLGCAAPGGVVAQVPPPPPDAASAVPSEPSGYRALVDEAKREYDDGNFAEARALFAKAHALFPNARALRSLGMTEFELRNYGDSIAYLERALASAVRPLDGELRTETERLLERARSFVARLRITTEPSSAMLLVDGMPARRGQDGSVLLEVGSHVLEFRAEGHGLERRVLKVIGGEEETLRVVLAKEAPLAVASASAPLALAPTEPVERPRRRLVKSPWLWTSVGVVAAAAATGIALGMSRSAGTASPLVDDPWQTGKVR